MHGGGGGFIPGVFPLCLAQSNWIFCNAISLETLGLIRVTLRTVCCFCCGRDADDNEAHINANHFKHAAILDDSVYWYKNPITFVISATIKGDRDVVNFPLPRATRHFASFEDIETWQIEQERTGKYITLQRN